MALSAAEAMPQCCTVKFHLAHRLRCKSEDLFESLLLIQFLRSVLHVRAAAPAVRCDLDRPLAACLILHLCLYLYFYPYLYLSSPTSYLLLLPPTS